MILKTDVLEAASPKPYINLKINDRTKKVVSFATYTSRPKPMEAAIVHNVPINT